MLCGLLGQGWGEASAWSLQRPGDDARDKLSDQECGNVRCMSRWVLCAVILVGLCALDYPVSLASDPTFRSRTGWAFGYAGSTDLQAVPRFGVGRVAYNFRNFCVFWLVPTPGKRPSRLTDWITVDGNNIVQNVGHLVAWGLLALLMMVSGFSVVQSLLLPVVFSIVHEYVLEGLYVDPSWIDLWLNLIGTLAGVFVVSVWRELKGRTG